MSVLDKEEKFTVSGKEYSLKYTVKAIMQAEKELETRNLLKTLSGGEVLSVCDAYVLFKWGLLACKEYTADEIEKIFEEIVFEQGMVGLEGAVLGALMKSGLLNARKNASAPQRAEQSITTQQN